MASAVGTYISSPLLPRKGLPLLRPTVSPSCVRVQARTSMPFSMAMVAAKSSTPATNKTSKEEEVEEDLPLIQEKALDLKEFTGSVMQAILGPRVSSSSLPWILVVPLAYAGLTFVITLVKTVKKFSSPHHKRKKLASKNAMLCKSIDEMFQSGSDQITSDALKQLVQKVLAWRIFCTSPVVMDMAGYAERGFKRKLVVQPLFGKVFYLSELPEFCSRDSSLIVKEIFGVTDEDAYRLRMHTASEAGDMESLEKMVDGSDLEDSG